LTKSYPFNILKKIKAMKRTVVIVKAYREVPVGEMELWKF